MNQCQRKDFGEARHRQTVWHHHADEDVSLEDMLHPEYWSVVSKEPVRQGDTIRVIREDMKLYVELLVLATSTIGFRVEPLVVKEFKNAEELVGPGADLYVKFSGAKLKWAVRRNSDGQVLKGGFGTEDEARQFMKNYNQAHA